MKTFVLIVSFLITSTCWALDLQPSTTPIKAVIHNDTASHSFRLMSAPITKTENTFVLTDREQKETSIDFSNVYSLYFYYKSAAVNNISISFCTINESGQEVWNTPSTINLSASNGKYYEVSLTNLASNGGFTIQSIQKVKIVLTNTIFLDELNFQYHIEKSEDKKPSLRSLKKKLKEEDDRFKEKKTKEYNKIRAGEYKDH